MEKRSSGGQYIIRDFLGGNQEYTSPIWNNTNQSPFVSNCDLRQPGIMQAAVGYSQIGTSGAANAVKGLAVFQKEDGTETILKLVTTTLSKWTGSTWSSVSTGFTNNSTDKLMFVNGYIDSTERIYFVTGHNDLVGYWDGTTYATVANTYAKAIEIFKGKIYLGNVKLTSTVYSGKVIKSPVGADTFNTSVDYFDDMASPITGMKVYAGLLYIFSDWRIGAYDEAKLTFLPVDQGTPSGRTIAVASGYLFYYNRMGVFMYGGAGIPTLISRPVQGWIEAVATPASTSAGVDKYGRYLLYIGNVTYDGTAYTGVILRFDPQTNVWDVLTSRPFSSFVKTRGTGTMALYAGDPANDKVYLHAGAVGLGGSAISSEWQSIRLGLDAPHDQKHWYKVRVTHKPTGQAEYVTIKYRTEASSSWTQIEGTNNNIDLSGSAKVAMTTLTLGPSLVSKTLQLQITHSSSVGGFNIYEVAVEYDTIGQS